MIKYVTRLALALVVLVALAGSLSTPALAADNPIDLELGGEGATSWDITGIKPGDSGTETVTLRNAGSVNGFVTIWVSDVVSSEGDNPESETGDTAEPGELDNYLLFSISCDRLRTRMSLPTTIDNLPQSASSWRYLRVTPLNVDETVTLDWHWELPTETDNVAQGDRLSFTINYMLGEFPPPPPEGAEAPTRYYLTTDLFGETSKWRISSSGRLLEAVDITSEDGEKTIYIAKGTYCRDEDGDRLRKLIIEVDENPPPPPGDAYIIGSAYDFTPGGATFEPPIKTAVRYDPADIPKGVAEEGLVVAYYDEDTGKWLECESTCDPETHCIMTSICHFTCFAIIGVITPLPPPAPAAFTVSKLIISPAEIDIGQSVTITTIVANTGGETGTYEVALKINGVVEDTKEVTVHAGFSKEVTFTTVKNVAGSYSVDVNGLSGSFTVKVAPPVTPQPVPPTPPAKPFNWPLVGGIIGGVVIVGLAIFFLVRRRAE